MSKRIYNFIILVFAKSLKFMQMRASSLFLNTIALTAIYLDVRHRGVSHNSLYISLPFSFFNIKYKVLGYMRNNLVSINGLYNLI